MQENYTIEKFKGLFEKEESGCSILINSTINSITDFDVLGLYCYLACRPPGWKIHPKHLMAHFQCSKDKIYRLLNELIDLNLMRSQDIREKEKFKSRKYKVWLRPQNDSPCPDLPDTVKPDTVNQDAYKTKKKENKECINTSERSSPAAASFLGTTPLELVRVFSEELPDSPQPVLNVITKAIDEKSRRAIREFKKYWEARTKTPLTQDKFRAYLRGLKQHCPGFLKEYVNKRGEKQKNGISVILHWENFEKYLNKQKRVPKTHHKAVALRYVEIWCKTLDNDKNAVTAQNRGRRAANLFLLEWSEKDAR